MSRKMTMKRVGEALFPVDEEAAQDLREISSGAEVLVSVYEPRNARQHRFFWALCKIVLDNSDHYENREHVAEQIKIGLGFYKVRRFMVPDLGEVQQIIPESISYESMSQHKFAQFLSRSIDYVCDKLLPGTNPDQLRSELHI